MATKTLNARLKIWVDTPTNWSSNNPTLLAGEVGIVKENNNFRMKIGDGSTAWNSLLFYDGNFVVSNLAPTISDLSYAIGTIWINTGANIQNGTFSLYILRSVINTTASWLPVISGTEFSYLLSEIMNLGLGNIDSDGSIGNDSGMVLVTGVEGVIEVEEQKTGFNLELATNANDLKPNGTASLGSGDKLVLSTHVHPSDTSKVDVSSIGIARGVAPLGNDSKVPAEFLPSYVDDVVDIQNFVADIGSLPNSGMTKGQKWYVESEKKIYEAKTDTTFETAYSPETDKIYVKITDNSTWRWSGTTWVSLSQDITFATDEETEYGISTAKAVNPYGAKFAYESWIYRTAIGEQISDISLDPIDGTRGVIPSIWGLQNQISIKEPFIKDSGAVSSMNLNNDYIVVQVGDITKRIKGSDLLTALGSLGYDNVTIGVNANNEYYVMDLGITNAKLAGGITKDKIASVKVSALDLDGDTLILNGKPS